jgi:hypothetical protein
VGGRPKGGGERYKCDECFVATLAGGDLATAAATNVLGGGGDALGGGKAILGGGLPGGGLETGDGGGLAAVAGGVMGVVMAGALCPPTVSHCADRGYWTVPGTLPCTRKLIDVNVCCQAHMPLPCLTGSR